MSRSLSCKIRSYGGKVLVLPAMAVMLGGCPMFAIFIDLDAERNADTVTFSGPNQSWLDSHCVRDLEVKDVATGEIMWAASSNSSGCLAGLPFDYGGLLDDAKPGEFLTAKELVPGKAYEIFVELDNGAGDGWCAVNEDGSITNND